MQASLEGPEGISTIRSRLQRNVEGRRLRSAPFSVSAQASGPVVRVPKPSCKRKSIDLSGFASSDVTRCRSEERPAEMRQHGWKACSTGQSTGELDGAHTGQTLFDPWPLLCPPGSVRYLSRIRRTCGCPGGGSGEVTQTCRCHLPRIVDSPIFVPDRGR